MSNSMALKQSRKDETQLTAAGGGGRKPLSQRPPEQTLRCPRCDSTNTKFCYYNNYNLTQPRYFCKTCRRYWTKGGALRNIPIGGGCRKNKKMKSCSSKFVIGGSSSGNGGSSPVMEFNLGGMNMSYPHRVNQFSSSSYGENTNVNTQPHNLPFMNLDPLGFSFPRGDHHNQTGDVVMSNPQEMGLTHTNLPHNTSVTSSLESLSCLNQDLHWKLQQQRLMTLFGGGSGGSGDQNDHQREHQKECGLQPILFQNLETSRKDVSNSSGGGGDGESVGGLSTEWFFDNRWAPANVNMNPTSNGSDQNGNINSWSGIQAWNHMNHYNALP